ncbi:hypothetical protein GPECTOR_60phG7 [Gonium pectorale]|uniref:Pherophorin domain-containing protein n=1 Tax=Gonium pectorale TaxID=33097 RepID=A0A150G5A7_GONPE|nr:hypothetical protein GPECTOR_60phG7 [Gonium pectorale]|eukprot:KXZ44998.1 hypothetical protein GPECTOR_60phG7 [Gonium pectorale]
MTSCSGAYNPAAVPPVLPRIKVCGAFFSPEDGVLLQPSISTALQTWVEFVVGGSACPRSLKGYTVAGSVEADASGCLEGFYQQECRAELFPLLPSPPRPPVPPVVQTHVCPQSTANVPYVLSTVNVSAGRDQSGANATLLCTTVLPQSCSGDFSCCSMDFAKVELIISPTCRGALRRTTLNGREVSYSWAFYDDIGLTAVKVPNLQNLVPQPGAAQLCWVLRNGPCASPSAFCNNGYCQANVFSSDNKCCPANLI